MRPALAIFLMLFVTIADVASSPARAEAICANVALNIPADSEGLYVNLITGVSGRAEGLVPGFDIDVYAPVSGDPSGQLKFYWGSSATGGAGVVTTGDHYAVLGTNSIVDGSASFSRAGFTGDTSDWQAGVAGYLGLRFRNESTGVTNYGWVLLTTTAPLGFPASIRGWCYENTGLGIATPAASADVLFADDFGE